jgi:hypothetical protein
LRKLLLITTALGALAATGAPVALAANPPGTGQPGQSCQDLGTYPGNGHPQASPGSPFNEVSGIGGAHYNSTNSQYDVACYQASQH